MSVAAGVVVGVSAGPEKNRELQSPGKQWPDTLRFDFSVSSLHFVDFAPPAIRRNAELTDSRLRPVAGPDHPASRNLHTNRDSCLMSADH